MNKKTILIDNREYDISNFKHPGGNVIFYMTEGQDASLAFYEFHRRSKKTTQILKSLPNKASERNPDDNDKEMIEDFIKFRTSLEERGYLYFPHFSSHTRK
jgi:hypothetical protein